ncbi:hypothetical protein BYT27DRAFT_7189351 [Phlegmacium glaucopus]|nr:hypothetical protein BYT27DRAFT_7189351 [Phlegmacium glaucopus]
MESNSTLKNLPARSYTPSVFEFRTTPNSPDHQTTSFNIQSPAFQIKMTAVFFTQADNLIIIDSARSQQESTTFCNTLTSKWDAIKYTRKHFIGSHVSPCFKVRETMPNG